MRSLSWKLGGALLLMVVVSVGLMAYITNLSTTREFRQYISHGNMMYTQSVEDTLSQFYAQGESWANIQGRLGNLLRSGNDRLIVANSSGIIVGDTAREWLGRTTKEIGLDRKMFDASLDHVRFLRNRYSSFDIMADLGVENETVSGIMDELFNEN